MPKLLIGPCPHCGERVIRHGQNVTNVRGTPINHRLTCTGTQAPDGANATGPTGSKGTEG